MQKANSKSQIANRPKLCAKRLALSGFTLMELLISISIIVLLLSVALIALDPAEFLAQARDQKRIGDLGQLNLAIQNYVNSGVTLDMDGPNNSNSCSDESNPSLYVSVATGTGGTIPSMPSSWTVTQSVTSVMNNIYGNGWIPINFASTSGGSPIPTLPTDPTNTYTDNLFYTYTCKTDGNYELTAYLESKKYSETGSDPKTRLDGGADPSMYETGSTLTLSPLGPVGYFSFDEAGATGRAYDTSGNNNNGTWYGSGGHYTSPGKVGTTTGTFNGASEYVLIPNQTILSPTSSVTALAWVNFTNFTSAPRIISKWGASSGYDLWATISGTTKFSINGGNEATGSAIATGTWYLMVGTYNMTNVKLYVNGALAATNTYTLAITTNSASTTIGSRSDISSFFAGSIDEARIYNRALNLTEIQKIYNAER